MLKGKDAEAFVETFLSRYLERGFGSLQKREIDILVFHLLSSVPAIDGRSNYEISNFLKISEGRVKSLRLEAALKHQPANHKAVLGKIVLELIDAMTKPDFDGGYVFVALEDPVQKREFEYAVKRTGYPVEYGINRELLKVKPVSLLAIVMENIEDGEKEFVRLVKAHISDKAKQAKVLDKALSLRQKINRVGEELSDKAGLVSLMTAAGALLA
jgi:hypothetical protein